MGEKKAATTWARLEFPNSEVGVNSTALQLRDPELAAHNHTSSLKSFIAINSSLFTACHISDSIVL
jgi:hypothetical protein